MTPMDFWFWGDAKSKVYAEKVNSLDELKDRIRAYFSAVTPETLQKAALDFQRRLSVCIERNGAQVEFY